MKIDNHILFLIVIIGIISVGIVGATVMSNDSSMKEETFDGKHALNKDVVVDTAEVLCGGDEFFEEYYEAKT